jgi:type I restriction enzyme M protein
MITPELKMKIEKIWEIFHAGGIASPMTIIDQITFLVFAKMLDDDELRKEANAAAFDMVVVDPIFDKEHQNCRWSNFRHYEAEAMFHTVKNLVFPYLQNEVSKNSKYAYAKYMSGFPFLIPSPRALVKIVDALNGLNMDDKAAMREMYEYLLSRLTLSGTNGQFITPRHIVKMMVELMQPSLEDTILDPALGSAGFLTESANYIERHYAGKLMAAGIRKRFTTEMFSGVDSDPAMLRIGAMNLMLNGIETNNVRCVDSLSEDNEERDKYSMILCEPPFTGTIEQEAVSKDIYRTAPSNSPGLLYVSLFLHSLRIGGRCACIVARNALFGITEAHKKLRKELLDNQRLEAIIFLPAECFQPYCTVAAAILIFTKTNSGGTDNVWFYNLENDGFSMDRKRTPVAENDIPDIIERFRNLDGERLRTKADKSFIVTKEELLAQGYNLSFERYQENKSEEVSYPPIEEIIAEYTKIQETVTESIACLERMTQSN